MTLKRTIGFVVAFEQVAWVAHAVGYDVVAQGNTPSLAIRRLRNAIQASILWSLHDGEAGWNWVDEAPSLAGIKALAKVQRMFMLADANLVPDDEADTALVYRAAFVIDASDVTKWDPS